MKQRLHKFQVAIHCSFGYGFARGSGILISKDLVLTTAHNFFFEKELF